MGEVFPGEASSSRSLYRGIKSTPKHKNNTRRVARETQIPNLPLEL